MASTPKTNPNETIGQFTKDFLDKEKEKMNNYNINQMSGKPRNYSMDATASAVSNNVGIASDYNVGIASDYNIRNLPITIPEGFQDEISQGTFLADYAGDFNKIPTDIYKNAVQHSSTTTATGLPKVEDNDLLPLIKNKATEALNERDKKRRRKGTQGGRKSKKKKTRKIKRRKRKSRKKRTKRRKKRRKSRRKR